MADMKKPEPEYSLTINGTEVKVFMSYGVQCALAQQIHDDGADFAIPILGLTMHPEKTAAYRDILLKKRAVAAGYGMEGTFDPDKDSVDPEEMEGLLTWMNEHMTRFFIQRGRGVENLGKQMKGLGLLPVPDPSSTNG